MYRLHPSWQAVRRSSPAGRHRPAARGPELVLVLQRRPGEHPQHPRRRRRRAVRHRLLQRQPVADAVRRRADARSRRHHPRSGERGRRPDQRDPRVPDGRRDVHLLDPGRDRPAGPRLRHRRAGSRSASRSTSRPTGRPSVFVTAGGDPPVAPATETLTFQTADPYAVEAERFAAAILDGLPTPIAARRRRRQPARDRAHLRCRARGESGTDVSGARRRRSHCPTSDVRRARRRSRPSATRDRSRDCASGWPTRGLGPPRRLCRPRTQREPRLA